MDAQVAFLKYLLERRYHERAVDTYVAEPFRGIDWQIQQMRSVRGRTSSVTKRNGGWS